MPPMQMSAIAPATAQRVASLKSSSSNSSLSTPNAPTRTPSTSSRLTAQTASSMQKQSDTSVRGRQLPTIAGSPSVGSVNSHTSKELKEGPPSSLMNSAAGIVKETPTRIPRISSRTSAVGSPTLKNSASGLADRRASLNVSGGQTAGSADPSPTPGEASFNEFGVLENGEKSAAKPIASTQRQSVRGSPSSRVPRQISAPSSGAPTPRKSNRDSLSFGGLRKASVGSVASTSSAVPSESQHRFSALSPSKGFKMLAPKMSLPSARSSASQSTHQGNNSPSSSRQSLSTPSPVPSAVDEEELLGDEEMMHYIRRQQTKKMASGASQKELDDLLSFPDPIPPAQPLSPEGKNPLTRIVRNQILTLHQLFYKAARYSTCHSTSARKSSIIPQCTALALEARRNLPIPTTPRTISATTMKEATILLLITIIWLIVTRSSTRWAKARLVKCSSVEIIALENQQPLRSFEIRSDSIIKHWLKSRSWTICANGYVFFFYCKFDR